MREKKIEGVQRRVLIEYEGEDGEDKEDEGARDEDEDNRDREGEGVRRGVDSDGGTDVVDGSGSDPALIDQASFFISGWVCICKEGQCSTLAHHDTRARRRNE